MKSPNKSYVGDQLAVQPQITVPLGDTAGIAMRPGELHQGQGPGPAASPAEGSEPSESDLAEKKNTQDWLRAAYAEAWKQVTHEDTLSMQRNGIFIVIQTALLATLASLSVALVRAEAVTVNMYSVPVAYFAMGSIFLLFSYFAVKLLNAWYRVVHGGAAYVALRWSTARRIEHEVGLPGVTLAHAEMGLRQAIREKKLDFKPYPEFPSSDIPSLKEHGLEVLGSMGEDAIHELIRVLRRLWWIIGIVGAGLILFALLLTKPVTIQVTAPQGIPSASPVTSVSPGTTLSPIVDPGVQEAAQPVPSITATPVVVPSPTS